MTVSGKTEEKLVQVLDSCSEATRSTIVELTGLAWTTAHDGLARLEQKGRVEREPRKGERGRPRVYWRLKRKKKRGDC